MNRNGSCVSSIFAVGWVDHVEAGPHQLRHVCPLEAAVPTLVGVAMTPGTMYETKCPQEWYESMYCVAWATWAWGVPLAPLCTTNPQPLLGGQLEDNGLNNRGDRVLKWA